MRHFKAFAILLLAAAVAAAAAAPAYKVQCTAGPCEALRPPQTELDYIKKLDDYGQRIEAARRLALTGAIIDVPVDVWGWDYEKTMAQRRLYGYKWVPAALMGNVTAAPNIVPQGPAPVGAILVPPDGGWKE